MTIFTCHKDERVHYSSVEIAMSFIYPKYAANIIEHADVITTLLNLYASAHTHGKEYFLSSRKRSMMIHTLINKAAVI